MFEWLGEAAPSSSAPETTAVSLAVRLCLAVIVGWVVGGTYFAAQRRLAVEAYPFMTTLVLLTVLVAMTTLIIGDSVARAFSLVGALSIVRFRTVVEDTRDTAFVIFAVVVGMAIGSGHLVIGLIGVPIVSLTAISMYRLGELFGDPNSKRTLEIRVGSGHDPALMFAELFQRYLHSYRLTSAVTAKQGVAFELEYTVQLKQLDMQLSLLKELNHIEGVQHIELSEP